MQGVSVIICCYNSSLRLPETLKHLALQKVVTAIDWEVIIVNNASTDTTVEVASDCWERYKAPVPLRIVDETTPGLSNAREKGFTVAQFEYLLFCDDDNWLCDSYIETVYQVMSTNPGIGALGGWGMPHCETQPPDWFTDFLGVYATGPQAGVSGEITFTYHVYGAGTTYRKSAVQHLKQQGFRYLLTGRNGTQLSVGEDHELCYALFLAGCQIWYDEKLRFYHFIPQNRLTLQYIRDNHIGVARANLILTSYKLVIQNRLRQRNTFKNTWQWLLLMNGMLFLRNHVRHISVYLMGKKADFRYYQILLAIETMKDLLLRRNQLSGLIGTISTSPWIIRREAE
jgi:glycosyltransferase involved in cell wall biosynthesis